MRLMLRLLTLMCLPWPSDVQVEDCLESLNVLASLMDLYQGNVQQLSELSSLVGEPLTAVQRCTMIALITIDVHNRWSL